MNPIRLFGTVHPAPLKIYTGEPVPAAELIDDKADPLERRAHQVGYRDGLAGRESRRELLSVLLVGAYDAGFRSGRRLAAGESLALADAEYHSRSARIEEF